MDGIKKRIERPVEFVEVEPLRETEEVVELAPLVPVESKPKKNFSVKLSKPFFRGIIVLLVLVLLFSTFTLKSDLTKQENSLDNRITTLEVQGSVGNPDSLDTLSGIKKSISFLVWEVRLRTLFVADIMPIIFKNNKTFRKYALLRSINHDLGPLSKETLSLKGLKESDNSINLALVKQKIKVLALAGNNITTLLSRNTDLFNGENQISVEKFLNKSTPKMAAFYAIANDDLNWLVPSDSSTERNLMIIFQNNEELRGGSGGSLGSFAIATIKDQKIKIGFGENIYKIDNPYRSSDKPVVVPPDELKFVVGDRWVLKDAGWSVDGTEAFNTVRSFYQTETGAHLDGVVSIDTTAVVDLLKVAGPINMPSYNTTLTADNFVDTLETEVHDTYFTEPGAKQENEPKKIIGDAMPILMDRILSGLGGDKSVSILNSIKKSFEEKHALLNFENSDFASQLDQLDLSGALQNSKGDYLSINNSNVGGDKTDQNMVQNIDFLATIGQDGSVKDSLDIKRANNNLPSLSDGLDRNFTRVILPTGSTVQNFDPVAGYFEQYFDQGYKNGQKFWLSQESGKTLANFWFSTKSKESSEVKLDYSPSYHLQLGADFLYDIVLQRQPGATADRVEFEINYPAGYLPVNVVNYDSINRIIILKFNLSTDQEIKIKFTKE